VKVRLDAKPFTNVTRCGAQPRVARMRLVFLVAEIIPFLITTEIVSSRHALEYYSPPGKNMSSRPAVSSL
jgi:hypothetical protein